MAVTGEREANRHSLRRLPAVRIAGMSEAKKNAGVWPWIVVGLFVGMLVFAAVGVIWFAIKFSESTTVIEEDGPNHMRVRTTVGGKK